MTNNVRKSVRSQEAITRLSLVHELRQTRAFDAISDINSATANLSVAQMQDLLTVAKGGKSICIPRPRQG